MNEQKFGSSSLGKLTLSFTIAEKTKQDRISLFKVNIFYWGKICIFAA